MKEFRSLFIEQTHKTPQIDLNHLTGELILSGKSIPENAAKIYEPVISWVNEYVVQARPVTNLRFNLEYFNTSSSIWLTKILTLLKKINNPDYILFIHLYMPVEEYDEMEEFDDIKDAFSPIRDIFYDSTLCIGIKLYGTDNKSKIIKDALVFI